MLFAFEGTGDFSHNRANFIPQNGFIWQFVKGYVPKGFAHYVPGPTLSGSNLNGIFKEACAVLDGRLANNRSERIDVVGYSRGGYLAIAFARYIQLQHRLTVNFMGLFDPVSYMSSLDERYGQDAIPGNIRSVAYTWRNPQTGSRSSWGNAGNSCETGIASYAEQAFMTSHSGMGGWPGAGDVTAERNQDEWREAKRLAWWMTGQAQSCGVFSGQLMPHRWAGDQEGPD
jgi:hypothetical protein